MKATPRKQRPEDVLKTQFICNSRYACLSADVIVITARRATNANGPNHAAARFDGNASADNHYAGLIENGFFRGIGFAAVRALHLIGKRLAECARKNETVLGHGRLNYWCAKCAACRAPNPFL